MQTYTLAIVDGVLFACLPDAGDLATAITEATAMSYGAGLSLDIVRGTVLTDTLRPGDEVVWRESSDSELLDAEGQRHRFAVIRHREQHRRAA
ncbi:hypothetical protein [Methylobacterium aerolatum]|uniref:Uncharacterized protein n=1 Tax=Methylobacterium aerolatum TaxID=418708 RepID=A0ABU0HZ49_9HYPH|nr:hypothetical protein [Methylobacterium aerolatum]MDQ0446759.1 hypothetical protein [Methylobacterium aerolatum]GJD33725.1 hypothetical protein FMGBMHLM_0618 [Methylobacterium aerolatum]